jgi:hypothetical protein
LRKSARGWLTTFLRDGAGWAFLKDLEFEELFGEGSCLRLWVSCERDSMINVSSSSDELTALWALSSIQHSWAYSTIIAMTMIHRGMKLTRSRIRSLVNQHPEYQFSGPFSAWKMSEKQTCSYVPVSNKHQTENCPKCGQPPW